MRKILFVLSASCLLTQGNAAVAARLDFIPSLSLDGVYDSNVFNTDSDEKGDYILRTTPGISFAVRMPETTLRLRSSLTFDRYNEYTFLNSNSTAVGVALDSMPPIPVTPRLTIAPSLHFVQAENSFRRTQLLTSENPLQTESIGGEIGVVKSRDYGGGIKLGYLVTPTVEFSVGGSYLRRDFLEETTDGVDSRVISGDSSVTYRFTPRFSSGIFLTTSHNTFANDNNSRTYAGGIVVSYRVSPNSTLDARGGASRTKETAPGAEERVDWSPYGQLGLTYSSRGFSAGISANVGQYGGGSFGLTTQTEAVSVSLSNQFSDRWWGDLSGSFQRSKSLGPEETEDLESGMGTAGVRYQPREWATLHLSGTAFKQNSFGTVGSNLKRYTAMLGFTIGYTYNLY